MKFNFLKQKKETFKLEDKSQAGLEAMCQFGHSVNINEC